MTWVEVIVYGTVAVVWLVLIWPVVEAFDWIRERMRRVGGHVDA